MFLGWSTKVPNYNPREIVKNLKRMIEGKEPKPMIPWFKNYRGEIEQLEEHKVNAKTLLISSQRTRQIAFFFNIISSKFSF